MARCLRLPTDPSVHLPSAVTPPTLATHRIAIRVLFQVFIKDEPRRSWPPAPGVNRVRRRPPWSRRAYAVCLTMKLSNFPGEAGYRRVPLGGSRGPSVTSESQSTSAQSWSPDSCEIIATPEKLTVSGS